MTINDASHAAVHSLQTVEDKDNYKFRLVIIVTVLLLFLRLVNDS